VRRRVADCLPKALLLAVLRRGVAVSSFLLVTPVGLYNAPAAFSCSFQQLYAGTHSTVTPASVCGNSFYAHSCTAVVQVPCNSKHCGCIAHVCKCCYCVERLHVTYTYQAAPFVRGLCLQSVGCIGCGAGRAGPCLGVWPHDIAVRASGLQGWQQMTRAQHNVNGHRSYMPCAAAPPQLCVVPLTHVHSASR
jgi:hypothetical protein